MGNFLNNNDMYKINYTDNCYTEIINAYANQIITNYNENKIGYNTYDFLNEQEIINLRKNYVVIDVDYLNVDLINAKIFNNGNFILTQNNKKSINNMLKYHFDDNDVEIYKKTDYLCNEQIKLCICNNHADDFRKIYDGINYKKDNKYISRWYEKNNK